MKHSIRGVVAAVVAGAMLAAGTVAASADTYAVSVTPDTGVKAGDMITVTVTGLTGTVGVYASLCKKTASQTEVPQCDPDQSHMLWITEKGGQGSVAGTGKIVAVGTFTSASGTKVDCLVDGCAVYVRGDHNNGTNYALIRMPAVAFAAGTGVVKKTDTPAAKLNGVDVKPNVPGNLTYRTPVDLVVSAASGLPVTLKSLNGNCAVDGTKVTALTGTGLCAIAAVTTGNDTYTAFSAAVNYPFYLHPSAQNVSSSLVVKKVIWGKPVKVLESAFTSDMGADFELTTATPGTCVTLPTATGWQIIGVNVGTCAVVATGVADKAKYTAASVTVYTTVTWK